MHVLQPSFFQMNILTFTTLWPNSEQPNFGVFVKQRAAALAAQPGVRLRVVAPVPYFPHWLDFDFVPAHWRRMARVAEREMIAGLETFHPRYFNPPKVGMRFYGRWMARGALALMKRLHAETPFDLIDAHYVYPDGDAARRLGEALRVPVSVTARGTDINLFAQMPAIRPLICRTLQRTQGLVAVSAALKERMVELGVEAEKVAVVRNGVDRTVFQLRDQQAARAKLSLIANAKILLSVAALVPLKRLDRLIEAMPLIVQTQPQTRLYIIGEGPERAALTGQIAALALQDRVFLLGAKPQRELADWYAAADLFCLASQREGCPNVVLEALACGTPVVASDVGGLGELLADAACGRLVSSTQADAASWARQLTEALSAQWERATIAAWGGARSWEQVAEEVLGYYARVGLLAHQIR
jgi:teichuronic acid biosynthesis glycosyltransferase TuaC